jgi:hypothetical protein
MPEHARTCQDMPRHDGVCDTTYINRTYILPDYADNSLEHLR